MMRSGRDKRSAERHSIAREASITVANDGSARPAMLVDISPSGFKATIDASVGVGEDVELLVSASILKATIQWCRGDLIGCSFEQKLPRHKVLAISRGGFFGDTGSPSA